MNRIVQLSVIASSLGPALTASVAHGVQTDPGLMFYWDASGDALAPSAFNPMHNGTLLDNGDGSFSYAGSLQTDLWTIEWNATVDPDPFIVNNLEITNHSAQTETFSLSVVLPIAPPVTPSSIMSGSITGTVTDNDGNDATVGAAPGSAVYTAFIDGSMVAMLLAAPFSATAGGAFLHSSTDGNFTNMEGPAALSTIGIDLQFTLSPGDSASFTSIFEVIAVPAPQSLSLLVLSGFLGRRRRNK